MLNENVLKVLKMNMWDLATCTNVGYDCTSNCHLLLTNLFCLSDKDIQKVSSDDCYWLGCYIYFFWQFPI